LLKSYATRILQIENVLGVPTLTRTIPIYVVTLSQIIKSRVENKSLLENFPEEKSKSFLKSNRWENEYCI